MDIEDDGVEFKDRPDYEQKEIERRRHRAFCCFLCIAPTFFYFADLTVHPSRCWFWYVVMAVVSFCNVRRAKLVLIWGVVIPVVLILVCRLFGNNLIYWGQNAPRTNNELQWSMQHPGEPFVDVFARKQQPAHPVKPAKSLFH